MVLYYGLTSNGVQEPDAGIVNFYQTKVRSHKHRLETGHLLVLRLGYSNGSRRPVGSMCNITSGLHLVSLSTIDRVAPHTLTVLQRLGSAAVFLIGGQDRDTEPIPILLRSGDVVIMSGPQCRRAYHGVPRILEDTLPSHLSNANQDDGWEPYAEYMKTTRININVRQVFPKDFDPHVLVT